MSDSSEEKEYSRKDIQDMKRRFTDLYYWLKDNWQANETAHMMGRFLGDEAAREEFRRGLMCAVIRKEAGKIQEMGNLFRELIRIGEINEEDYCE